MENYLYLLEFFVETLTFSSNLPEYPLAHEVMITGEMGALKMEVFTVHNVTSGNEPHKEIDLKCGKSTLFSSSPDDLLQNINVNPFTIHVFVNHKEVASAPVGWTKDFYTLVKKSPNSGVEGPVSMQDQFLLKESKTDRIMGDIRATVRLSLFGENIQTTFQVVGEDNGSRKKFLVKGARGDVTFECKQFGTGNSSEVLPMTTLFTDESAGRPLSVEHIEDDPFSWMALFKSSMDSKYSIRPDEFNMVVSNMFEKKNASNLTFDIISIMEKPEENKFIDLRIKGGSRGFIFEFDTSGLNNEYKRDSGLSSSSSGENADESKLTAEQINKMLCKNKDCPAAKKFKEFGIGPLAITKGLGTLYGEPSLPVTYGMSQTYGVFDEYGPYGLFSRPKRASNDFVSKTDNDWAASCWQPKRKKQVRDNKDSCGCQKDQYNACYCKQGNSPLRLSGGGEFDDDEENRFQECQQQYLPLRLTGGGVLDYDDVKSPFHECKEVMDQFDEVLAKYKKALGPCGKTTCPFAPNVVKETCKKMCPGDGGAYSNDAIVAPQIPETTPVQSKLKANAACGSPKCAYAKYKSGLVDQDADMELQYLPAPTSGKCGHPKCPNPVQLDLPPIHWDCPDPLPKGRCKNPECPYLPKEIKCLNAVLAKGPCGNFNCPFSPPPPCDYPYCPFQNKECPYKPEESDTNSLCDNPECPFAPKSQGCCNPSCQFSPKPPCYVPPCGDSPCIPPQCPYMVNPFLQNLLAYYAMLTGNRVCFGGAECPYTKNEAKTQDGCASPNCPFQQQNTSKAETCTAQKKSSPCYVPDLVESEDNRPCNTNTCKAKGGGFECSECGLSERNNEFCGNPQCSEAPKTCYIKPPPSYSPSDDACDNPECPYAPKPSCPQPPPCCKPPSCPITAPPCGLPFPCLNGIDPLQALLAYCMPITICPDGICPYPGKDVFPLSFGGPVCQMPTPPQQCIVEEKSPKDEPACDEFSCPYVSKGEGDKADDSTPQQNKPQKDLREGVEYTSDTRVDVDMTPCTTATCKSGGGELVCTECPCGSGDANGAERKSDTRLSIDMAPCSPKTCQSKGGALVCDVCPCSKPQTASGVSKKKVAKGTKSGATVAKIKMKKIPKNKYVYSVGDKYPGVQIGHKRCVMPAFNVPPKMGWLWNIFTPCMQLKPRRGWRPGAIAKSIAATIRKHREAQGLHMLELKELRKGKKGYGTYESGTSINVQPKPTLHIKKHDGCYWITMNPLKDPHTLVENESPYMECTPLQFKIVKNKKEGENEEYKSCFCGEDQHESSSSDSELEIEFTPPAGIIHPERFKKKRNVVHCDTQYMTEDFEIKKDDKGKKEKKGKGKKGKKDKGGKGGKGGKKGKKK